jgi:hypothetical protein
VERPSNLPWTVKASYKCQICLDVVWGKDRVKQHYQVEHNETAPKELGDMVHAYMHSCAVCKMKVLNDTFELASHLAVRHSMSVDGYAQEFLKELPVEITLKEYQRKNIVEDEPVVVSPEPQTPSPEPPSLTDEFHKFSDNKSETATTSATPDKSSGKQEDNDTESEHNPTLVTPCKSSSEHKEKDTGDKNVQGRNSPIFLQFFYLFSKFLLNCF